MDLNVILLHHPMLDKQGKQVTTSITMIDIHDLARSGRTYGVNTTYIAHPSPTLRKLSRTLKVHWESGLGATYNPNRREALTHIDLVADLDEAIHKIDLRTGKIPKLIATSARGGPKRVNYSELKGRLNDESPYLLLFGTGWGMPPETLDRCDYILEPICGPGDYNHLSVRAACAITLDRLCGKTCHQIKSTSTPKAIR